MVKFIRKARKLLSSHGYGAGRKLSLVQAIDYGMKMKRLHLGCGNIHISGWCNVDVLQTGATDLVLDIQSLYLV